MGSSISSHQRVPFSWTIFEKFSAMVSTPWLIPSETMKTMPLIPDIFGSADAFPEIREAAAPNPPSFIQSRLPMRAALMPGT